MSKILVLNNAKIISIKKIINNGFLVIKDNLIFQINEGKYNYEFQDAQVIECHNQTIIPGFIDLHVHGGYGYSLMDGTIESINNFAKLVPKEGVTKFCYATVTASKKEIDNILSVFAKYMKTENKGNKARIIGAYLEGPFISELQKGAHTPSLLHVPDLNLVKFWNIISNKNLKFIVYAPEIDPNLNNKNSNFISSLIKNNIIPSVGHSNATFKEITKTIEYGLMHITHLYNAMSPYNHRDPGVVPASLYYDQLVTELICDGIHVDIDILAITYKIKGADGICMITDAMSAKGQPDGKYLLGPLPVIKSNNKVTVEATGKLAGSIATMIAGFKNLLKITNNNWQDCIKMASYNSAKQVGIANKTGDIVIGKLADIIVLTKNNDIFLTICEGKIAYQQE
ncbi:N-acetylglucosamine-6-phosphate deacetylase [Spiroplasma endosymbiont of Lariophagus distinguendus]|uniref:N-acetylglucosamine-6-phosphate deacetylase n=1 Tax=Spiroplasma endosymbiont of Lariophagus distinguendus TaxID=2935082 RepID=UPI00207A7380|nr:N-acetylglucosamine-6-phosphate deacetylase [Spiroplasma endosymbiont of Lariophagus distinguendus]